MSHFSSWCSWDRRGLGHHGSWYPWEWRGLGHSAPTTLGTGEILSHFGPSYITGTWYYNLRTGFDSGTSAAVSLGMGSPKRRYRRVIDWAPRTGTSYRYCVESDRGSPSYLRGRLLSKQALRARKRYGIVCRRYGGIAKYDLFRSTF